MLQANCDYMRSRLINRNCFAIASNATTTKNDELSANQSIDSLSHKMRLNQLSHQFGESNIEFDQQIIVTLQRNTHLFFWRNNSILSCREYKIVYAQHRNKSE